jgi:hypothetical protein
MSRLTLLLSISAASKANARSESSKLRYLAVSVRTVEDIDDRAPSNSGRECAFRSKYGIFLVEVASCPSKPVG